MVQFAQFSFQIFSAVRQTGLPLETVCKKMKSMGYDFIDLSLDDVFSPEMQVFSDCGLKISTVFFFPSYTENGREMSDRAVEAAVKYSAPFVMAIPGENHDSDDALKKSLDCNFAEMNRLASALKKHGIGLILEDFDWGNQIFSRASGLKRYLDALPELRVCLDTGNFCHPEDKDILTAVQPFLGKTVHAHFKDRAADDHWGEYKTCPVGAGILPLEKIADLLKKQNFSGVVAAEFASCFDPMSAAEESIRNLKKWFPR